jgi:hypothetical protein
MPSADTEHGPSSDMVDHGRPRRGPDGGPPGRAQRNFTDPDSRIMPTKDGSIQGYNGQLAVHAGHQIITAHRVTATAGDQEGLVPLLEAIRRRSAARPASSRLTPASAARTTSRRWRRVASGGTWRPAGASTAMAIRAAGARSGPVRGWRQCGPGSGAPELSSNVVAGGASGGVLNARLAVNEADAPDHLAEPGRAVQSPPAALCAQTEPEDHGQRRPA